MSNILPAKSLSGETSNKAKKTKPKSNTVWKKRVKEGLSETNALNTNNLTNYGHNVNVLSTDDEKILSSTNAPNQTPTPTPAVEDKQPIAFTEQIKDLFNKFDPQQAKNLYKNTIGSLRDGVKNLNENIASPLSSFFYDDIHSATSKKEIGTISSQISIWITTMLATYIIVLNWWYILCYTNFHIDFRDYILSPIHWPMAPVLNAIELINYNMLTVRMDANAKFPSRETMQTMWDWRPITFCFFHAIVTMILVGFKVTDTVASVMMNNGVFFTLISALSIYYFGSLFMKEKWFDKYLTAGFMGIMIFIALIIGSIIGMFLLIAIICPFFVLYVSFFSNWSILAFNYFSPMAVYGIVNQMFQELKESPIPAMNNWDDLSKELFQNAHTIYISTIVFGILTANITQSLLFTNKSLMMFAIIVNVIIAFLLTSGSFSIVYNAIRMIFTPLDI